MTALMIVPYPFPPTSARLVVGRPQGRPPGREKEKLLLAESYAMRTAAVGARAEESGR